LSALSALSVVVLSTECLFSRLFLRGDKKSFSLFSLVVVLSVCRSVLSVCRSVLSVLSRSSTLLHLIFNTDSSLSSLSRNFLMLRMLVLSAKYRLTQSFLRPVHMDLRMPVCENSLSRYSELALALVHSFLMFSVMSMISLSARFESNFLFLVCRLES